MCGISGFVDFGSKSRRADLERMTQMMPHRGPVGEGYHYVELDRCHLGMGHKRLSIIDLSHAANQPMHYAGYTVVFNGELYNYRELRRQLESEGHRFETQSDTEVLLHSIEAWGLEGISEWIGMFAIALYHEPTGKLHLIRDRAGVKPLFYYWDGQILVYGSELKVVMTHPSVSKTINLDALAAYMDYGYVPTPSSILNHTYKVRAGHYMTLNTYNQMLEETKYWDVTTYYRLPKLDVSYKEAMDEVERLMTKAFGYRMVADVPVGIFLSGGYDSVSVASILQKEASQQINTFTIGMTDPKIDEAPYAKQIAAHIGTRHHELYCSERDMLEILSTLPEYYCEPFADSSAIPTILVSRLAAQSVTVALSADGGDEVFGGYIRYEMAKRLERIMQLPLWTKKGLTCVLGMSKPILKRYGHSDLRIYKLQNLLLNQGEHLMRLFVRHFEPQELKRLIKGNYTQSPLYIDDADTQGLSALEQLMIADYKCYLLDDILAKVDRATMSVSIEGREPFLDHQLIAYVAQLPDHYKYHNGIKKRILRDIVHRYVPKKLMERPKMGFAIPLEHWLRSSILPSYSHLIDKGYIDTQGIFDYHAVSELILSYERQAVGSTMRVWHLICFQMWYDHWIK